LWSVFLLNERFRSLSVTYKLCGRPCVLTCKIWR